MTSRQALNPGSKVKISNDIYTIKSLITRGGTSLIYEAQRSYCANLDELELDHVNYKTVILKELAPYDVPFQRLDTGEMVFDPDDFERIQEMFRNEIANISTIQAQNTTMNRLPDMDAYGAYNNTVYIAMNHIKGLLLSDYIRDHQLTEEAILRKFKYILRIVKTLHEMAEPYYHLDLKPNNFIVGGLDTIYLFDFGSAMKRKGNMYIKNCTVAYSAPEVVYNDRERIKAHSDIYSLGVILYEFLTKRAPSFEALLLSDGSYVEASAYAYDFNSLLRKMLHHDSSKRFQEIKEVLAYIDMTEKTK